MNKIFFVFFLIVGASSFNCRAQFSAFKSNFFVGESNGVDESNELLLLKFNDDDSTFVIYWFISQSSGENNMFCRMTFEDSYYKENELLQLPSTLTFNEFKINTNAPRPFPLDETPRFQFDPKNESLSAYTKILEKEGSYSVKEVEDLIKLYAEWEGG